MSMEIKFDRASKFYEPGDKVTGTITVQDSSSQVIQHAGIFLDAEGYMDTVSMIRGNIGRLPMKEEDRIYFMKKKVTLSENGRCYINQAIPFEFVMESTEKSPLVDAYIGVEFSIVYEVSVTINKSGKPLKGSEKFYC